MSQPLEPQASTNPADSAAPRRRASLGIRAWRFFKSLKMGLLLLGLIALACVYGTVFYAANSVLGDNAIPLAKERVFNAGWFFALMAVFFVQFIISTWHVTKMSFGIWGKREFRSSRDYFRLGEGRATVAVKGGPDRVEKVLRQRFTRAHRDGNRFFAHRGLRARIGPTIVHAGIVMILLTGLMRILLDRNGMILSEGRFIAAEGETTNEILVPKYRDQAVGGSNVQSLRIPFEVTVLDFDEIKHANSNAPAYFSSLIKVRDLQTGDVRVAKLDMNHSHTIGSLQFHQAGYQPLPPIQTYRVDFDVRDAQTGERIAVTDASPQTRVQVGNESLFLEIDGEQPGNDWRMYSAESPSEPIATGQLLAPAGETEFSFKATEIYPDFRVRKTGEDGGLEPYNASNDPNYPAVHVVLLRDGMPQGETWLFLDPSLAPMMPAVDDRLRLELDDLQVARDTESIDWTDPALFRMVIRAIDPNTDEEISRQVVRLGAESQPITLAAAPGAENLPPDGAEFAIYPIGRSMRYMTILSVVDEPTVPYNVAGVLLIALGAVITFTGRYRAFYGLWDEEEERLHLALVPRFGTAPDPKELEALVDELQGAGTQDAPKAGARTSLAAES
ncbi:cytochrome c biogenesis protein ResB [bacterium]|nr:cytochrome c biogenesis protein ResB [bacterium]